MWGAASSRAAARNAIGGFASSSRLVIQLDASTCRKGGSRFATTATASSSRTPRDPEKDGGPARQRRSKARNATASKLRRNVDANPMAGKLHAQLKKGGKVQQKGKEDWWSVARDDAQAEVHTELYPSLSRHPSPHHNDHHRKFGDEGSKRWSSHASNDVGAEERIGESSTKSDKAEVYEERANDEPWATAIEKSSANKAQDDALTIAQDQLRAFFSRSTNPSGSTSSSSNLWDAGWQPPEAGLTCTAEPAFSSADGAEDTLTYGDQGPQSEEDIPSHDELPPSRTQLDTGSSSPRKFSRPTLSDLQKVDVDEMVGLYQSDTVWDPSQDYALMNDGPPQRSLLEEALESGPRQYIVVIIDFDNLVFSPRHMMAGHDGGKFVCNELRTRIASHHRLTPHKLDLRVRLFASLPSLAVTLSCMRIVRRDIFFDFIQGIIDSSLHNYVVNVGKAPQAADLRAKAALADAILDRDCYRAYLGGLDDYGYLEDLSIIQRTGMLESKVNLIQTPGIAKKSQKYRDYAHRALDLDYLFSSQDRALNTAENYNREAIAAAGSEEFWAEKQPNKKPPCVFYHLTQDGCERGGGCAFSHEPLSMVQKERLRRSLKQRKCPTLVRGQECLHGEDCLFAH